ncbi:RNA-binding protein S4 [Alicyclobacillus hesperidum subsp. aegles]|uniref:YlmH family RNA-binding protein n=1 Tax=Alicyclobacillus hesperidum TaxID=89784 RepID=UPI00222B5EB8|nr:YlmH/Sll1252 family protein [Alicyclobacillus hesperidum]GLG01095.1 RNA-binding protein S4 [Alicyclobacillus hesperidum subsp. aegles]
MSSGAWLREEERPFLKQVEDWAAHVHARGTWYLTDFLTPRERWIAESAARHAGLVTSDFGGYTDAERVRMLLMPEDWHPEASDYDIKCLAITALEQPIRHRDVLGSILGLGIQRKTVGDIAVFDQKRAYVFATSAMGSFLARELHRVGRGVVEVVLLEDPPQLPPPAYEEQDIFVMSPRIDAIVAQACHLSRANAQEHVARGYVSLNFVEAVARDEVRPGDILSVRGFGRIRVVEAVGTSRSGRIRMRIGILRSDT